MTTINAKIGGGIALGLLLLGAVSRAGAADGVTTDIESAVKCESQAAVIRDSISTELHLKAANLAQWRIPKAAMPREIADADKKYDAIIASLETSENTLLQLAQIYRLQATEIQTAEVNSFHGTASN
jgi:hypothetical protein